MDAIAAGVTREWVTNQRAHVVRFAAWLEDHGCIASNNARKAKVLGGPLWQRIPAVESGQVHDINDDLLSGIGIQAAQQILAQFEKEIG